MNRAYIRTFVLAALASLCASSAAHAQGTYALRVARAETVSHGTVEHAVVLIEDGKISAVGQDLEVERGIPVYDWRDCVLMPGLVDCWSRMGLDSDAGNGFEPQARASDELYADQEIWGEVLERGVTTLGLVPSGFGIPGHASAIRPKGATPAEMVLRERAYLLAYLRADAGSKKMLREALKKADEHEDKVSKAKEKWEKDKEKKADKKSDKKDDAKEEKKDEKKEDKSSAAQQSLAQEASGESGSAAEGPASAAQDKKTDAGKKGEEFVPPAADDKVRPFLDARAGKRRVVFAISKAADYLHLLDALGKESFEFDLRVPLRDDVDLFYVIDKLGEKKLRVIMEPRVTLQPATRRERNLPQELAAAGGKPVFVPRSDNLEGIEEWLRRVGELVAIGLDRQVALKAVTLEPAHVLGLGARLGSIEKGKDANLLLFRGDPFEVGSRLQAVVLEGRVVHGEVK